MTPYRRAATAERGPNWQKQPLAGHQPRDGPGHVADATEHGQMAVTLYAQGHDRPAATELVEVAAVDAGGHIDIARAHGGGISARSEQGEAAVSAHRESRDRA